MDGNNEFLSVSTTDNIDEAELRRWFDTFVTVGEKIQKNVLYQHNPEAAYAEDPQIHLEATRQVVNHGQGLFSFQGEFVELIQAFDKLLVDIAIKFGAQEQDHPSVWPVDLYHKIDYFGEYPHHAMLMTSVKDDYQIRTEFAAKYSKKNSFDSVALSEHELENIRFGAPNACCDCCYYSLSDTQMDSDKMYTTRNKVVRNENSNRSGLDRLRSFTQRDIVEIGTAEHVKQKREQVIQAVIELLERFELAARLETAHDPFFGNDTAMKNVFQYISNAKLEILARLNFNQSYIAVGSINWHMDFFGKAFNFKDIEGNTAHSGCLGFGFERFIYALYCQFGIDTKKWPLGVRESLSV
ncbi:MAG: aminoacyl--tRNA ligase-related protein [Pseudomonadales bacterium]